MATPTPQPMQSPLAEAELEPPPIGPLPGTPPRAPVESAPFTPRSQAPAPRAPEPPRSHTPQPSTAPTPRDTAPRAAPISPAPQAPPVQRALPTPQAPRVAPARPPAGDEAHERAHRLARVLVSDILVYNQEARDRALQQGNLPSALAGEINRAWELYKTKVDPHVLESTSYFKDALNQILANGQSLF